jgi:hypothetical protein
MDDERFKPDYPLPNFVVKLSDFDGTMRAHTGDLQGAGRIH